MLVLLEGIETVTKLWYNNNIWPRKRLGRTCNLSIHVYWGASGLPTIGTHKLLRIPPFVPTSHLSIQYMYR